LILALGKHRVTPLLTIPDLVVPSGLAVRPLRVLGSGDRLILEVSHCRFGPLLQAEIAELVVGRT